MTRPALASGAITARGADVLAATSPCGAESDITVVDDIDTFFLLYPPYPRRDLDLGREGSVWLTEMSALGRSATLCDGGRWSNEPSGPGAPGKRISHCWMGCSSCLMYPTPSETMPHWKAAGELVQEMVR